MGSLPRDEATALRLEGLRAQLRAAQARTMHDARCYSASTVRVRAQCACTAAVQCVHGACTVRAVQPLRSSAPRRRALCIAPCSRGRRARGHPLGGCTGGRAVARLARSTLPWTWSLLARAHLLASPLSPRRRRSTRCVVSRRSAAPARRPCRAQHWATSRKRGPSLTRSRDPLTRSKTHVRASAISK